MPETKSGVSWEPVQVDDAGKVLAIRILIEEPISAWQIVQAALDAERYRVVFG